MRGPAELLIITFRYTSQADNVFFGIQKTFSQLPLKSLVCHVPNWLETMSRTLKKLYDPFHVCSTQDQPLKHWSCDTVEEC